MRENNEVVGFLLYQLFWWKFPLLSLLKIHEDYYKQGLWTILIEEFEKSLKDKWHDYYYSSTWEDNPWSQVFHSKKWFSEMWRLNMSFWEEIFYIKKL